VYPACLPALYTAAATYALQHPGHPAVVAEREEQEAAAARRAAATKLRAEREAQRQAAGGRAPASPAGVGAAVVSARTRTPSKLFEPPTGGSKKRKKEGEGREVATAENRGFAAVIKSVTARVESAHSDWEALQEGATAEVAQFVNELLQDLEGTLKQGSRK
jgi:hypothetical protein